MSSNTPPSQSQPSETLTSEPSAFDQLLADVKSDINRAMTQYHDFSKRVGTQERSNSSSGSNPAGGEGEIARQRQERVMRSLEEYRNGLSGEEDATRGLGELKIEDRNGEEGK